MNRSKTNEENKDVTFDLEYKYKNDSGEIKYSKDWHVVLADSRRDGYISLVLTSPDDPEFEPHGMTLTYNDFIEWQKNGGKKNLTEEYVKDNFVPPIVYSFNYFLIDENGNEVLKTNSSYEVEQYDKIFLNQQLRGYLEINTENIENPEIKHTYTTCYTFNQFDGFMKLIETVNNPEAVNRIVSGKDLTFTKDSLAPDMENLIGKAENQQTEDRGHNR